MSDAAHTTNPIVQKILSGTAAENIRLAAARAALPIPVEELLHVLQFLDQDPTAEIRDAAAATAAGLDDDSISVLLKNTDNTKLLGFIGKHVASKPASLASLIRNRATPGDTLVQLAGQVSESGLELLVTNQVALIRTPAVIDALLGNPALNSDQRRRLQEVREEFFVKRAAEEKRRRDEQERLEKIRAKTEWTTAELERLQEELTKETQAEIEAGALLPDPEDQAVVDTEEAHQSTTTKISTMSVPEKVLLAIRGTRSDRAILIRDSNRLVAVSVIKSPKMSDAEVENIAGLRNVHDEVLRIIGTRRDWLKNYPILLTLTKNPRTPLPVAMNLLSRVQTRDLRHLQGDRNVSETLRRQAKQILDKAQKQGGRA